MKLPTIAITVKFPLMHVIIRFSHLTVAPALSIYFLRIYTVPGMKGLNTVELTFDIFFQVSG